jgi:ribosomal protein L37AE/L43A
MSQQIFTRLIEGLEATLREYDRNTCTHEETHRGGAIWTICDWCGAKWADDRGGFEPYVEPAKITAARDALHEAKLVGALDTTKSSIRIHIKVEGENCNVVLEQ